MNAGLGLGDKLTFFVAGREIEAEIAQMDAADAREFLERVRVRCADGSLPRRTEIHVHEIDVSEHDEHLGVEASRQQPAGQVLVDNGVHPLKCAALPFHGNPSATAADHDKVHADEPFDLSFFHNGYRPGRNHHPPVAFGGFDSWVGLLGRL